MEFKALIWGRVKSAKKAIQCAALSFTESEGGKRCSASTSSMFWGLYKFQSILA